MHKPSEVRPRFAARLRATWRRLLREPGRGVHSAAAQRLLEPIAPIAPTNPPGPTIVLLNDCRDQVNYGANALVDGLIEIVSRSAPNATILPIPSHWLIDTSHGLGAFVDGGEGLGQPRATFPKVADQFAAIADMWMEGRGGPGARAFLSRLEGADLVVLNGEGSIYRTNVSAIRELFLAWFSKERLGIPTIFVNGSIHLTDVMPVLPAMVRKTFRSLDAVAVREAWSLRNLEEHVPGVDAQLFPDSAFAFTPDDARDTPAVRSIRGQIGESPYFCFDPGTMPMDDRGHEDAALHQLISALERVAPRAVFVASGPADRYVERIARDTDSLYVDGIVDYREWMALVADARFLVTGRYHNAILAAIMGCPSITFGSTTHKVHGACEMLDGLVGSPYDGTDLRPQLDAIERQARGYTDRRGELRQQLQEVCGRRRAEVLALGELVATALQQERPRPIVVHAGTTINDGAREGHRKRSARTVFRALQRRLVGRRTRSPHVEHPVCHDLKAWAASHGGAERRVIAPAFTTSRPLPKTIESDVDPSFTPLCTFPVPERALVKIPNGRIRGQVGLVVLPTGEFAGELVALTPAGRHSLLRAEPAYYKPLPSHALRKRGNFYPVLGLGVGHYYHWSHDLIMGMRAVESWLPPDTQLIVPEKMQPFQIETLGLLGLDDHPRVPFPRGEVWELENLYVVTPRLKTQIDSSEPFRWFRTAAMGRYGAREVKPERRLYLTRRNDGHWRTTNERDVERALGAHGFETVAPGELSFPAQVELFGQAEVIVGTGAGLFNMVFSPPGTKVLQFQVSSHMVHALWTAAAAMGFDYHYLLCDGVPNAGRAITDLHVPIAKLEASLRDMAVS